MFYVQSKLNFFKSGRGGSPPPLPLATRLNKLPSHRVLKRSSKSLKKLPSLERVITNLNSSQESLPDCILVVVLNNCEPEILYILAELVNMCLKKSCFPEFWNVSSVVSVFNNVVERSSSKKICAATLLSVVGEVFEKI